MLREVQDKKSPVNRMQVKEQINYIKDRRGSHFSVKIKFCLKEDRSMLFVEIQVV